MMNPQKHIHSLLILGSIVLMSGAFYWKQVSTVGTPIVEKMLTPQNAQNIAQIQSQTQLKILATDTSETLLDQGQTRTYVLHTPPATQPQPLLIALHGSGMHGKEMAEKTALSQLADQKGFVVAYPDGLKQKWNVSGKAPEDNVAFIQVLIRQVQQIRSIDPRRIYVVGLSNGGILAQKLACEAPSQIAAIATVAASLPTQFSSHCQTDRPVPLMMVNGTADSVVLWEGGDYPTVRVGRGLSIPSIFDVIDFWQQHNACTSPAEIMQESELVEVHTFSSCANDSEIKLVTLKGAGHIWSGGSYGKSAFGDTTDRVWQFFQRHSLPPTAPPSS